MEAIHQPRILSLEEMMSISGGTGDPELARDIGFLFGAAVGVVFAVGKYCYLHSELMGNNI